MESGRIIPAAAFFGKNGRRKSESWTATRWSPSSLLASSHTDTLGSEGLVPSGINRSSRSKVERDRWCIVQEEAASSSKKLIMAARTAQRNLMRSPPPGPLHGPTRYQRPPHLLPLRSGEH